MKVSGPYLTKGGKWELRWREGSKHKSATRSTEQEANDLKAQVERLGVEGKPVVRRKDVPTLEEFAKQWMARRTDLAASTLSLYAELLTVHVLDPLGHLPLVDLRPRTLAEWQERRLDEGAGPATLGKAQRLLGQILDRAVLPYEYLDQNPVLALQKPSYQKKAARWLTAEEVEALRMWYLERDDVGSAALISAAAYIGRRPQDLLAAERSKLGAGAPNWTRHKAEGAGHLLLDAKNVNGQIVRGSKTEAERKEYVYVPEPVLVDLREWCSVSHGYLLWGRAKDHEPWTKTDYLNWVSRAHKGPHNKRPKCFKAAAEDVGLGGSLTPYHLRHTAATLYAAAGWNQIEVAQQLGHSPQVSASVYQHLLGSHPEGNAGPLSIEGYIRQARGMAPAPQKEIAEV